MKIRVGDLKGHFKKLKADLKPMSFTEKLDHIWTYYKEYMFVALMLVIIAVAIVSAIGNMGMEYYNCGVMCNVELSREGHAYLTDEFFEKRLGNPDGMTYLTTMTLETDEVTVNDTENRYQSYMHVLGQVEAKELDYMLVDEYSFGFYMDDRIYMDLREIFTQEQVQQFYDQGIVVQIREESEEAGTPMGIDITDLPFGKECLLTEGKAYLVFIRNTKEPENCMKLWEHILNWQSKS